MSAPVTSSSLSRTVDKSVTHKSRGHTQSRRKTRIVRRRGRAKDGLESDDEIVREVGTDSETEDDLSSLESVSDSDTEPVSEGVHINGRSRPLTPSTSHSPQSHDKNLPPRIDDSTQPFFTQPATWEDMVTEESATGPAELPVIDFEDFTSATIPNGHATRPLSRKSKKRLNGSRDRSPPSETKERGEEKEDTSTHQTPENARRSRSSGPRRPPGQSARQAYQQRLESDPSFVPTVGGFWGHDERLLDKDLRSLSGWWRGRWQGRGRGRGFGARGRGGHDQGPSSHQEVGANGSTTDVPPIERPWTHDGFEEMKRKEEQRRASLQQQQQANQTRGVRGGRGGFVAGRGGRGGTTRGGFTSSPPRSHTALAQGRVWYAMKPELMWTKQHEAFLFFDAFSKPRKGQGPSYRIRLPGSEVHVVHGMLRIRHNDAVFVWPNLNAQASDANENAFIIRIPKSSDSAKAIEPLTTVEEASLEEIFTVRPNLVTAIPISVLETVGSPSTASAVPDKVSRTSVIDSSMDTLNGAQPEQVLRSQLEQLSIEPQTTDPARLAKTEEAVLKKLTEESTAEQLPGSSSDLRPALAPLQTVFTPPPIAHTSPAYGAPYPYGPALPPGVALNPHGMPYEVATGRPVYLAPPPMYAPRPLMPSHMTTGSVSFIPSHMHHPSMSPDFMSQPSSHTPPMNGFIDPSTGTPLFSLPRQTRIEIRAPTDESDGKGSRKSQLRQISKAPVAATDSSRSFELSNHTYYPSLANPGERTEATSYVSPEARAEPGVNGDLSNQQHADTHMVPYPSYQPYYYPESYGYYPYVDMSQVGQYDMYPSDPRSAGTVYY
ncbi:hypothetical protein AX17_001329 [Amanita inopinata Kibby_2008]|nr:hypothetical protein AX17_001329 [Amanita inopinata Kibby_2008]